MNTLELLLKIHDALGNSFGGNIDNVPTKLAVLVPEIRVKIREFQREEKENKNGILQEV